MARAHAADDERPARREDLVEWILGGAVEPGAEQVGVELERIPLVARTGARAPFDGPGPSVEGLLERLLEAGPDREAEREGGRLVGLDRPGGGSYQLEPGGQVEWASPPFPALADLGEAVERTEAELEREARAEGLRWLEVGVDPENLPGDVPWVPKRRYEIMRSYLPGDRATWMMALTASIQVAVDHTGPDDLVRRFRAANVIAPLVAAIFANAPRENLVSARYAYWRRTDPDRCGICPIAFDEDLSVEAYVEHCLDIPMMVRRAPDGTLVEDRRTFRAALEEGLDGRAPTVRDWDLHLAGVFYDIRLRSYIECRSADLPRPGEVPAVAAVWRGALATPDSTAEAGDLLGNLTWHRAEKVAEAVAAEGLSADLGHAPARRLATELCTIAIEGLRDLGDDPWILEDLRARVRGGM